MRPYLGGFNTKTISLTEFDEGAVFPPLISFSSTQCSSTTAKS